MKIRIYYDIYLLEKFVSSKKLTDKKNGSRPLDQNLDRVAIRIIYIVPNLTEDMRQQAVVDNVSKSQDQIHSAKTSAGKHVPLAINRSDAARNCTGVHGAHRPVNLSTP